MQEIQARSCPRQNKGCRTRKDDLFGVGSYYHQEGKQRAPAGPGIVHREDRVMRVLLVQFMLLLMLLGGTIRVCSCRKSRSAIVLLSR